MSSQKYLYKLTIRNVLSHKKSTSIYTDNFKQTTCIHHKASGNALLPSWSQCAYCFLLYIENRVPVDIAVRCILKTEYLLILLSVTSWKQSTCWYCCPLHLENRVPVDIAVRCILKTECLLILLSVASWKQSTCWYCGPLHPENRVPVDIAVRYIHENRVPVTSTYF